MPTSNEVYEFPISSAQQRMWILYQIEPNSSVYNIAARFWLRGPLNLEVFERSVAEIVRRHESLRTFFSSHDDQPFQLVAPELAIQVEVIDLRRHPSEARFAEAKRLAQIEARKRFLLEKLPLFRVKLLQTDDEAHIFLWTIHHIIADGWSIGVIIKELGAIYDAYAKNSPCPLADLPIQYPDFTMWQREWFASDDFKAKLAYCMDRLRGPLAETNLPTNRPRLATPTLSSAITSVLFPRKLFEDMEQMCRREGVTLFMLLLAAYKTLLWRYTGERDVVVGSPTANRGRVDVESLIGFFVNTLVLRTEVDGDASFLVLLKRVSETCLGAFAHQEVPFEKIVEELRPVRAVNRNPLFQTIFYYHKDFVRPLGFGGMNLTSMPSESPGAMFDLNFYVIERSEGLRANIDFSTDLFDLPTIERMLGHFQTILECVVATPDVRLCDIPVVTAEERTHLTQTWNYTARDYPKEKSIHRLFEEQVARNGGKPAVEAAGRTLTYTELNHLADRVAAQLGALKVKRGDLVGLCLERSVEMVAGVLGILKAGAAYVPMDPAFPTERLGYMVEDARMPVIVTQKSLAPGLPPHQAQVLLIDGDLPITGTPANVAPAGGEELAYVIFTSGSTGRPKGVKIPHRAVVNFLNSMRREPGLSSSDVLLSVTTLSFDIAGLELFLPLTTGAKVVVATRETATDGRLLAEELQRTRATVMQATPSTWWMLLEAGWKGSIHLKCLIGGEAVPRDLINKLVPLCASLWNMYGPTETTIWSTVGRLEANAGAVSIGQPIDNTQVYVVNAAMQLQPVNVAGELLIGGDGLSAGYLDRPELTAEKFIPDTFSGQPGARLYRTGDLARWNANGTLECLGRMDQQVKIRGFRIELGEIEAVLAKHRAVRQSVVIVREDLPGEKRLFAYIVASAGEKIDAAELRAHLQGSLPDYMVPAVFVPLEQLPLTPNGKVNTRALPAPNLSATAGGAANGMTAPRNPTEVRLLATFQSVLGVPVASIHDNFFDLGGHSLLAVKLMNAIEREFGLRLALARLFDAPTVEKLAAVVANQPATDAHWDSLVPILPQKNRPVLYFVHGAGGNILLYREVAKALGPDISSYGFQSQGLDRKATPLLTVDAMAQHYVRELMAFQPSGPYHLTGYCMGGAVIYEMARLIIKAGGEIGLIALLDSYNLSMVKQMNHGAGRFSAIRQKFGFHVENLIHLGAKDIFSYLSEKFRMAEEAGKGKIAASFESLKSAIGGSADEPGAEVYIQEINHEAGWNFVPQALNAKLTIFSPRKNYDFFPDPNMGWFDLTGGRLEVIELPVNPHAMLLEPCATTLANELKKRVLNPAT